MELAKHAICYPTKKNMRLVDQAFQTFYKDIKSLTYLSNLIYYNAINFDKVTKKHAKREMLTLDQPLRGEKDDTTHKDMIPEPNSDMTDEVIYETIGDYVEDSQLYQAIQTLKSKQRDILTYKYVHGLQNKEIAILFGDSPQNISKLHQRSLKNMENHLDKGGYSYGDD